MTVRVLHVVESLKPEAGSVAISLRDLFPVLREHDVASTVATLDPDVGAPLDGAEVHIFDRATAGRLVEGVDVVHVHTWRCDLARALAHAAWRARKPYAISPHGLLGRGPYQRVGWREQLRNWLDAAALIRRAHVVTAVNDQELSGLRHQRVHRDCRLLPYGITVAAYESPACDPVELPAAPDGRCLLLLGPIHPIEGCVPVLKAFGEIGQDADGWHIVMAGPTVGDWRDKLEAAVRRKGATDRVLFTGAEDVATQRAWLSRASVVATTSLQVRIPVSTMQAVAAGVPVIASAPGTAPGLEKVVHLCTPNRENLRNALQALFRLSDDERTQLGDRAREVGRSLFDWPALVGQYVELYRNLA